MAFLSLWFERSVIPAWGIEGGWPGAGPDCRVFGPNVEWTRLEADRLELPPGSAVRVQTGGGFGDPLRRDQASVARDVRHGLVSHAAARETYAVAVAGDFRVDTDATETLRAERPAS